MSDALAKYVEAFSGIHVGRVGDHVRPHKPILLLAVLELAETGRLAENRIELAPQLIESFGRYFEIVQEEDDQPTPVNPFFYLRTDGFWHHQPKEGMEKAYEFMKNPQGIGGTNEIIGHAYVDDDLFELLQEAHARDTLRDAIVTRYFAKHHDELTALVDKQRRIHVYEDFLEDKVVDQKKVSEEPEADEEVRDAAFSRVVRRVYDYRCAACGLRIILPSGLAIVDAAHLIPFSESHDNDPRNGMTLCKNHHWAMDRFLIAPGTDCKWRISGQLDDRIEGQRDLVDLEDRSIILPSDKRYYPKKASLVWRTQRLRSAG